MLARFDIITALKYRPYAEADPQLITLDSAIDPPLPVSAVPHVSSSPSSILETDIPFPEGYNAHTPIAENSCSCFRFQGAQNRAPWDCCSSFVG
jgi:hypothetical protein